MLFENDFKEFLQILKEQNVRYLLVGAYAMGLHGTPRNTGDMDIWIDVTAANVEKLLTALNMFGFGSMGLAATDFFKRRKCGPIGL